MTDDTYHEERRSEDGSVVDSRPDGGDDAGDRSTGDPEESTHRDDRPVDETTGSRARGEGPPHSRVEGGPRVPSLDVDSAVTYGQWTVLGLLSLLALVATIRLYSQLSRAISIWFSPDFVPIFQAAFNFVVLVVAAIGISLTVRRMRE